MTFLEIVQALAMECDLANTPADTTNQIGQLARLVNWCRQAYVELQSDSDANWRWLRHTFTLTTTASQDTYAHGACVDSSTTDPIDRFNKWRFEDAVDPPRIYLSSAGKGTENDLIFLPYTWFKQIYRRGSIVPGYPAHIAIDPQDNILLGPEPNDEYIVTGEYYRSAQILGDENGDDDVPEMPSQYHYLIVYDALRTYGFDQAAQEVLSRAERQGTRLRRQLENNQSEIKTFALAGAMA